MTRDAAARSALIADTLHLDLARNMIGSNHEGVQRTLQDLLRNPEILQILIADTEGGVTFSSHPGLLWKSLKQSPVAGMDEAETLRIVDGEGAGPREMVYISSVPNRPACHDCHSPAQTVIGIIGLRMSMTGSESLILASRYLFLVLVFLTLFLLYLVSARFFSRNVTGPVKSLLRRFQEVSMGELRGMDPPAPAPSDEIGALRLKFEDIVEKFSTLYEEEQGNRLALLEHDRSHQKELEDMNLQLAERGAEFDGAYSRISYLTRQLEERDERLQSAFKNISSLNRVGAALSSELDIDRLVKLLINIAVKGLRAEIGYIMLMDEESNELMMKAWTGLGEDFDHSRTVKPGESISGIVAKTGQPLLLPEVDGEGGIKPSSRFGFTRHSVISAPIKLKNKLLGVIELTNKKGAQSFNEDDLLMLGSIANQSAVAIENAYLYQQVQGSYFDTIKALVQAVEEKDKYTRGHSERVNIFSVKISRRMGFSEKQIRTIQYSSVLHDIGKIGVNVNIIQKPGKLTQEQFNIIKDHPLIGERIISPIAFLKDVLSVVSQHHERYDGLGYPLGLDGSEMAPEARVLSVADAYDAMITARPYRSPLTREDAIAELRRGSGTQFDPIVVEHFLEILEADPEIRKLEESLSSVGT